MLWAGFCSMCCFSRAGLLQCPAASSTEASHSNLSGTFIASQVPPVRHFPGTAPPGTLEDGSQSSCTRAAPQKLLCNPVSQSCTLSNQVCVLTLRGKEVALGLLCRCSVSASKVIAASLSAIPIEFSLPSTSQSLVNPVSWRSQYFGVLNFLYLNYYVLSLSWLDPDWPSISLPINLYFPICIYLCIYPLLTIPICCSSPLQANTDLLSVTIDSNALSRVLYGNPKIFFYVFFYKFYNFRLYLRSVIHLKLIFVQNMNPSSFSHVCSSTTYWKDDHFPTTLLCAFVKKQSPCLCGFISGLFSVTLIYLPILTPMSHWINIAL